MERLQKVIANNGYTSRRKAEELIIDGRVKINGIVVKELGIKVTENDVILIDNKPLQKKGKKVYYLLNKPRGVISSVSDNLNRKTVIDLIDTNERIYPIGRLDYDTTGLIILTNDGELANKLMHPKNKVLKTYIAKVEGVLGKEEIDKLKNGVLIDGRKTYIYHFKIRKKDLKNDTTLVEISIIEGRNHIIKKIFDSLNHPVIKLSRISYDFLNLNGLKSGQYRELTLKEVKKLYSIK